MAIRADDPRRGERPGIAHGSTAKTDSSDYMNIIVRLGSRSSKLDGSLGSDYGVARDNRSPRISFELVCVDSTAQIEAIAAPH